MKKRKSRCKRFLGQGIQFVILLITILLIIFGWSFYGIKFFTISLGFLITAALFEYITLIKIEPKKTKNRLPTPFISAFLYVHFNIDFIRKYSKDFYEFKKSRDLLINSFPYVIIFLYILIASFLFGCINYFSFLIYLIPVITNLISFFSNKYEIIPKKNLKKRGKLT